MNHTQDKASENALAQLQKQVSEPWLKRVNCVGSDKVLGLALGYEESSDFCHVGRVR